MSQSSSKQNFWGIALIAAVAITPFLHNADLQEQFLLPRTLYWAVLASIGGIALFFQKDKSTGLPLPIFIWLGFVLWQLSGLNNALSLPQWWFTFYRFGIYASVLLSSYELFRRKLVSFDDLAKGLSLLAIFGSAMALSYWSKASDVYEVYQPFGHKNFTSAALLVALLGSLRLIQAKQKPWNYIAIGAVALATFTIIVLRTRGVWIGGVLASITLLIGSRYLRPKDLKTSVIPVKFIALGFGVLLMGIVAIIAQSKLEEKVLDTNNIEFRFRYWDHSLQMFTDHPIAGVGAGQWVIHFPEYGLGSTNTRVSNGVTAITRPHNDMLWMLAEGGAVGFVLYAGFWILVLYSGGKQLLVTSDSNDRMRLISALAMVVGYLSYAMGEFPIERLSISIPTFIAASYLLSHCKPYSKLQYKAFLAIAVLAGLFASHHAYQRIQNSKLVVELLEGNDTKNAGKILSVYPQIDQDYINIDFTGNPLAYFNGLANLFPPQTDRRSKEQQYRDAKESFELALAIHPWHSPTYVQYGNWHKFQKQYDSALELYERGLAVSPFNIDLRLNRIEIYMAKGNYAGAAQLLLKIQGQKNNPRYQQFVIRAFRKLEANTIHPDVNEFLLKNDLKNLGDRQLYEAFLRYRDISVTEN